MLFDQRVKEIKEVLFNEYEISEKVTLNDWTDEANELALLVSLTTDKDKVATAYNDYLISRFEDDGFTDFLAISYKLADAVSDS